MLEMVRGLGRDDLVLALISGGASALLSLPDQGLAFRDKQKINEALLRSGAAIGEMNTVRKHLSAIKGGRLAAAAFPARVVTLVISDVPGDDPADIGSGPTVADKSTVADARAVLAKYGISEPHSALEHLERVDETPKPGSPELANTTTILVATPQLSLESAAEVALLSGGETTVAVRGKGRGGRNVEFLLSLAVTLDGLPGVFALAADTDGVDGAEEIAGAIIAPDTLRRAEQLGMKAKDRLADNDAHTFFAALGDQVITGPTLTNVNDFRAILVIERHERPAQ
jgi:hydroxypyruvate reductase